MLNRGQLYKAGKFLVKLAITFAALYLVARQIEIKDLKVLLVEANISFLILALGLFVVAKLLESRRSNLFFRVLNIQMSEALNTSLYLLGMFYNLFLPGGIGGDPYRVYWLKKRFQTGLKSLITAFSLNQVIGLAALLSLLLISFTYVSELHPLLQYAFMLIVIVLALYYLVIRRFFSDYSPTNISATAYSFFIQILQLASAHYILYALGVYQDFGVYWFIFLLSGIAFIIPVTVGGGGFKRAGIPLWRPNASKHRSQHMYCLEPGNLLHEGDRFNGRRLFFDVSR